MGELEAFIEPYVPNLDGVADGKSKRERDSINQISGVPGSQGGTPGIRVRG